MPLLGKNRFKCQPTPENLSPNDEIYVCKATGEVFTDYEKFFDQTILCNSLIWTCDVTGHSGMTFLEALESERNSKRQLESFPLTLHLPILHVASLTHRTIFKDLLDDIFSFAKDRYFIGETVTINTGSEKKTAVVIKVFPMANNSVGQSLVKSDADEFVDDGKKRNLKSQKKSSSTSDSSSFQYMSQDQNTGVTIMSTSKNMGRNRNLFNRDSCRLFLKEHCEHKGKGVWRVKDSVIIKYNLPNVKFSDYSAGPVPNFPGAEDAEHRGSNNSAAVAGAAAGSTPGVSEKKDGNIKKKEAEKAKDWLKPRDDMLCDDLKDLPATTPVTLFGKDLGSAITVMEFLSCFRTFCGIDLPNNFTIADLDRCLTEQSCESIFLDLIQQLLMAIFQLQLGIPEIHQAWKSASKTNDPDIRYSLALVRSFQSIDKKSKSQKSQPIYETPLRQLPLDASSLTEILRLHLLLGYYDVSIHSEGLLEMRIEQTISEFSRSNPEIMSKLQIGNVLDLTPSEKLKVLSALIEQVLSLPTCRDFIEDNYNRLKNIQKDLRTHMWAVQRRERDLLNYNFKKKQEEDMLGVVKKKECPSKAQEALATRTKKRSILDLKDKDFEEMPMEGIDWDQLTQEEKDHIKNWSDRRQAELQVMVETAQADCCLAPIGMDRTYRKYWIFRSTPGLFVEDSKSQDFTIPLMCLSPVPQDRNKIKTIDKYFEVSGYIEKPIDENEQPTKKPLGFVSVHDQLANRGKVEWSFYSSASELDSLTERLNARGHRENHLKNVLIRSNDKILTLMTSCDIDNLTKVEPKVEADDDGSQNGVEYFGTRKKGEMELARTIADMVLDLEERIFAGSLGSLKLSNVDREEWKMKLVTIDSHDRENGIDGNYKSDEEEDEDDEDMMTMNKFMRRLSRSLVEVLEMVDSKYLNPPLGDDEETRQKKIKMSVEQQQQQLLEHTDKLDDADASNSQESFQNHNNHNISTATTNNNNLHKTDATKWKELVTGCSNFSQLYLCLSLLDSSIAWGRSALNARCKICRKKKDGESMLLCDGCDQGHHMYCLKPPLKKVPEGDWFCPTCQPKNPILLSPRKTTRNVRYKDYDSDFGGDDYDEDSLSSAGHESNDNSFGEWKNESARVESRKRNKEKPVKKSNSSANRKSESTNKAPSDNQSSSRSSPTTVSLASLETSTPLPVKSTRSGREIIKPKGNEQFIEEALPVAKSKKKDRYTHDETYTPDLMKKRRQVRSTRYNDDFDYNNDDNYEDEDRESRRKSNRKRKCPNNSDFYESETTPSKRVSIVVPKSSQRKINASMKAIEDLVTDLMKNDNAWPFLKPVTIKQAPDYFDIIEKPMDLSTIKYKIYRFEYEDQNEIIDDLRLMLYNCNLYNCPNAPVHDAGQALEDYLDKRLEEIEKSACSSGSCSSNTSGSTRSGTLLRKRTSL